MPLNVKNYKWKQTEDLIIIQVQLKGVPSTNVDIFTSDNYIKASFPPFLFELFLFSTIDENNSRCTISEDEIIFELQKAVPQTWEKLTADMSKMEMLEKRKEIIEKHHRKTEEEEKGKKEKLAILRRFAIQQQIERDTMNKNIIDERRNEEKSKAMNELEAWKMNEMKEIMTKAKGEESFPGEKNIFCGACGSDNFALSPTCSSDSVGKEMESRAEPATEREDVAISERERASRGGKHAPERLQVKIPCENVGKKSEIFPIPLPRNLGTVTINFTHRDFPTPSRESQAPQEEEWLKKQVEARRATGFVAEDLRPEECNPSWLKDKGDSFYKTGNYLGAVSAYSHAIKLGSKMASLYSNRAAAHLGLGNFHKALDDCSQALELLTPHVAANVDGRAKCHARRGAVLCRLGLPEAGLADFEEAVRLKPEDVKLLADMEHAKLQIKSKPAEGEELDGIEVSQG